MIGFHRPFLAIAAISWFIEPCLGDQSPGSVAGADVPQRILSDARMQVRTGDFDEAAKTLRSGLRLHPRSLELADYLIHALIRSGRGDDAVAEAQLGLEVDASAARRWALMGDALFGAARFEEAEQAYLGALDIAECARAHVGLGRLHESMSNRKTARHHFTRAHELEPNDPEVLYHWAVFVAEGEEAKAGIVRLLSLDDRMTTLERDRLAGYVAGWDEYDRLEDPRAVVPAESVPATLPLFPVRPARGSPFPENRRALEVTTGKGRKARLLLDTGAVGLLISNAVARKLEARAFARSAIGGFGGSETVRVRRAALEKARFGPAEIADAVAAIRHMDSDLPGIEGLVGTDVFRGYLLELDLGGGILRLHPLPAREGIDEKTDWKEIDRPATPDPAGTTLLRRFGSHLFVRARIGPEIDGWLLVDSGSFQNILALEIAESLGETRSTPIMLGGYGGMKEARASPPFLLSIGSLRQENRDVPAIPFRDMSGRYRFRIAGLLGAPFLNQVVLWINYRDGWVRMVPRAKPAKPATP